MIEEVCHHFEKVKEHYRKIASIWDGMEKKHGKAIRLQNLCKVSIAYDFLIEKGEKYITPNDLAKLTGINANKVRQYLHDPKISDFFRYVVLKKLTKDFQRLRKREGKRKGDQVIVRKKKTGQRLKQYEKVRGRLPLLVRMEKFSGVILQLSTAFERIKTMLYEPEKVFRDRRAIEEAKKLRKIIEAHKERSEIEWAKKSDVDTEFVKKFIILKTLEILSTEEFRKANQLGADISCELTKRGINLTSQRKCYELLSEIPKIMKTKGMSIVFSKLCKNIRVSRLFQGFPQYSKREFEKFLDGIEFEIGAIVLREMKRRDQREAGIAKLVSPQVLPEPFQPL